MRVLGTACMTWWVSATVLCVTILGASWIKRDELRSAGRLALHVLFGMVSVFFATMVVFGVQAVVLFNRLTDLLSEACLVAGPARCLPADATAVAGGASALVATGTTSFLIFLITWVISWVLVAREGRESMAAQQEEVG